MATGHVSGKRDGNETMRYPNWDEWPSDMNLQEERSFYVGDWKENQEHGKGMMRLKDGRVYEGEFQAGIVIPISLDIY